MENMRTNIAATSYSSWCNEYLKEAENLKRRVNLLREKARTERSRDEADHLLWRASMLYGMYLDCLHTGRLLKERSHQLKENISYAQTGSTLMLLPKAISYNTENRDGAA